MSRGQGGRDVRGAGREDPFTVDQIHFPSTSTPIAPLELPTSLEEAAAESIGSVITREKTPLRCYGKHDSSGVQTAACVLR